MKTCTKCGLSKPTNKFHSDHTKIDGLYPSCKACRKESQPTYIIDRLKVRASAHRHYHKNVKKSRRERLISYYRHHEENKRRHRERRRRDQLQAIAILGGRCARCGYDKDPRALQIDHIIAIGGKKRRIEGYNGARQRVLKGNHTGLQCLCANCNLIKRWESGEGIIL